MHILFIGGTGEISWACVERSIAEGHKVFIFNRGRAQQTLPPGAVQIIGDVSDPQAYGALAELKFDVVCQFLVYEPADMVRDIGVFGGHCGQYIFISSASAYRKPIPVPVIDEQCPLGNPYWEYSRKKQACEEALLAAHDKGLIAATIVRPSHTYRTRLPGIVVSGDHLAWRILRDKPVVVPDDGESIWTITHASDFARAFVALFGKSTAQGEAFHITSSQGYSWNHIVQSVGDVIDRPVRLCPVPTADLLRYEPAWEGPLLGDKVNSMIFDNRKIMQITPDWRCEIDLADGLQGAWQHVSAKLSAGFQPDPAADLLIDRIVGENSGRAG